MKIQPVVFRQKPSATSKVATQPENEKKEIKENNHKTRNIALLSLAALGVAGILINASRTKNADKMVKETAQITKEVPIPQISPFDKAFSLLDETEKESVQSLSAKFLQAKENPEKALAPSTICVQIKDGAKRAQILENLEKQTGARLVKIEQNDIIGAEFLDTLERQGSEAQAFHALTGQPTIFYINDLSKIFEKEEKTFTLEELKALDVRRKEILGNSAKKYKMSILFDNESEDFLAADHIIKTKNGPENLDIPNSEDLLKDLNKFRPTPDLKVPDSSPGIAETAIDVAGDIAAAEVLGEILGGIF